MVARSCSKREGYRRAFAGFDPGQGRALHRRRKVERLLADPGDRAQPGEDRVDDRQRPRGAPVQRELGSLDAYLWSFVDGTPIVNRHRDTSTLAAQTPISTGDEQGHEEARLPLRRPHDDVRADAVGRDGQRPHGELLPVEAAGRAIAARLGVKTSDFFKTGTARSSYAATP